MGTLFRSEDMSLVQLILNAEASYLCIAELGELGILQFRDLNLNVNSFEKKFVRDVRRCEEMERQVRFLNQQLTKCKISSWDTSASGDFPDAPFPKEMATLEETLHSLENELKDINHNSEKLASNLLELVEIKHVLRKTQSFFDEMHDHRFGVQMEETGIGQDFFQFQSHFKIKISIKFYKILCMMESVGSARLSFTAGTIPNDRIAIFEKILWRATHGNAFLKLQEINDEDLKDPSTQESLKKSVFIVFYQGQTLAAKVKKIAEGIRATIYPIAEDANERREIQQTIMQKLEDVQAVCHQTEQHKTKLLNSCSRQIRNWHVKILKSKSIYHIHNLLSVGNGSTLISKFFKILSIHLSKICR